MKREEYWTGYPEQLGIYTNISDVSTVALRDALVPMLPEEYASGIAWAVEKLG
ncbi:hypothetical protein [Pantoea coffeiphila]|uniref:hypothetical protein n=1 Tax=Pantoea coffeiphila TaxID=1465635 RepID=UPI001559E58C|nr:hypothetical protein [Pantoea coffeiphila]